MRNLEPDNTSPANLESESIETLRPSIAFLDTEREEKPFCPIFVTGSSDDLMNLAVKFATRFNIYPCGERTPEDYRQRLAAVFQGGSMNHWRISSACALTYEKPWRPSDRDKLIISFTNEAMGDRSIRDAAFDFIDEEIRCDAQ